MVRLLAERSDTKSNVKFRSQLQASYVLSHTEELWYNETVCLWMTKYIYIYKVKLATVVKDDLKAPFSIGTTPRCSGVMFNWTVSDT